jgi:CBS domain-containing protein
MRIQELMTKPVATCSQDDSLNIAARLMWEHDCGSVPVLGDDGKVVGILTDRDICMAAYTQGRPLSAIRAATAMAREVYSCHADEAIEAAEELMADKHIRRLPVVDAEDRPVGVLSLNDLARSVTTAGENDGAQRGVVRTLAAICEPRGHRAKPKTDAEKRESSALVAF